MGLGNLSKFIYVIFILKKNLHIYLQFLSYTHIF
jgi:hypothetical protein